MSESPSLYDAAMAELDANVSPDEYIRILGPDLVRKTAAEHLQAKGVELVGTPSLVEWAIDREAEDVVSALYLCLQERPARGKSGRPKNNLTHNLILAAAFYAARDEGLDKTAARRAAARRLGSGTTKDKIEKAERALLRDLSRALRSLPRGRMLNLTASLVIHAQNELAETEARLRDEEAAARKRRFYSP